MITDFVNPHLEASIHDQTIFESCGSCTGLRDIRERKICIRLKLEQGINRDVTGRRSSSRRVRNL